MTTYYMTPEQYRDFCRHINSGYERGMAPAYTVMDDLVVHTDPEDKTRRYSEQSITPVDKVKGLNFFELERNATGSAKAYVNERGQLKYYVVNTDDPKLESAASETGALRAGAKGGFSKSQLDDLFSGKMVTMPPKKMTPEDLKALESARKFPEMSREEQKRVKEFVEKLPSLRQTGTPAKLPENPYGPEPIAIISEKRAKEIGNQLPSEFAKKFAENLQKFPTTNEFGKSMTAYLVPPEMLKQIRTEMFSQEAGNLLKEKGKAKR